MFDWLQDLIDGITDAIANAFSGIGQQISNTIWNTMMKWFYETIYGAVADFFTMMGNMGAEVFDLKWVQATVHLFTLFGWALFVAGVVVAIFDVAIEYQSGRANIKNTALNILKGFFACSLIGVVPIELYRFCIFLQNTFSHDLSRLFANGQSVDIADMSLRVLTGGFQGASVQDLIGIKTFTDYGIVTNRGELLYYLVTPTNISVLSAARQFIFTARCRNLKPSQVFKRANEIEKTISEQGFEVHRMKKQEIKRFLALYFEASMQGELMSDADGIQYLDEEGGDA